MADDLAALAAVHETHVLAQAREIEARREADDPRATPLPQFAASGWLPSDVNPTVTPVPKRPVFAPVFPPPPAYTAEELAQLLELVHPLIHECGKCGHWQQIHPTIDRLKDQRLRWIDDRQADADAAWRASPAVQRLAAAEAETVADRLREQRDVADRQARRQRRADQLFAEAVGAGMTPGEAQALVRKQYADVA